MFLVCLVTGFLHGCMNQVELWLTQCQSLYLGTTMCIVTGSFSFFLFFLTLNPAVRNDHMICVSHLENGPITQQKDKVRQTINTCGFF